MLGIATSEINMKRQGNFVVNKKEKEALSLIEETAFFLMRKRCRTCTKKDQSQSCKSTHLAC